MQQFKQTFLKTALFELGLFRSVAAFAGETRSAVALSHLLAFPRSSSTIRQAGQRPQVATPVGAVFYNKGCEYTATPIGTTLEVTGFLRVEASVLRDAIGRFDQSVADRPEDPFTFSDGPVTDRVFVRQAALERRALVGSLDPLAADEEMVCLVHDAVESAYAVRAIRLREKAGKSDSDYARWTQELIARHFRAAQSLAEIAGHVGISPFHLHRIFKRVVGMTIHAFRDRMRLRAALSEMLDSPMPLSLIAIRSGYSSQSHFTDAFRSRFGVPPAEGRRLLRAGRALSTI
ncbi:MAG: helix-turn-helix transcriptional regulator [Phycisphaeraceae bacterium]|nr:helix-turn-helix transcriptional regulator [Phycisphaeraceae bacterium]